MRSPFKPTAGRQPPVLVGRDRDIENFRMAIEEGPGPRSVCCSSLVLVALAKPSC